MKENIIGRNREKSILNNILESGKSEFVAVCGRRRIGKTFLIREYFEESMVFQTSGLAGGDMKSQIKTFYNEMLAAGLSQTPHKAPKDWTDIFFLLRRLAEKSKEKRKVIMLDELPWMDTPKSGFISALEHFWNTWASNRKDIILIVCGSATSWMMDKLINNHGGLHNRLTSRMFLQPFTLSECEEFLAHRQFYASRYDIAILYMTMGGIPFYLDQLNPQKSLAQNIDELFFSKQGALRTEFKNLYAALFKNSEDYITVVKALCKNRGGLTRNEIIRNAGIKSGKGLSTVLANLESCGFTRTYKVYNGKRGESEIHQLVDFYTLFYFHFIVQGKVSSWESIQKKSTFYTWAVLTFEKLALDHIGKIKESLGISGIESTDYDWRFRGDEKGAQIDLVIDRADNTATLCEMKFSIDEYEITESYEANLRNKIQQFMERNPRKSVQLVFVTTFGLKAGRHNGMVNREIKLGEMF